MKINLAVPAFVLALVFVPDAATPQNHGPDTKTGHERLAAFYSGEIQAFNHAFEKHVETLDKCLEEMTRFEAGHIFSEHVACSAANDARSKVVHLLEGIMPIGQSLADTIKSVSNSGYTGNAYDEADERLLEATGLFTIYNIKLRQAVNQAERVRSTDAEIGDIMENLIKAAKAMVSAKQRAE